MPDQEPAAPAARTAAPPDRTATAAAIARGMRAQLAHRDAELSAGARQVGWKIGFNTPAIQQHFGLTDPVVGYLVDTGVTPEGATVSLAGWSAPAVEVEVAVRVGPDGAVAGLAPALELVDLDLPPGGIEPVLAGNICQRGVVFGDEVPGVDPWATRVVLAKNGHAVAEGALSEDPAVTVAFVRGFLAAHGAALEPGHRIIAGSLVAPVDVEPGDEIHVAFGPLGELGISFGP